MLRKDRPIKVRDFGLSLKAVEDDGTFSGYGSVFGEVDSYNEVVAPGAFRDSLDELAGKGRKVPVLWQHQSSAPLGVYKALREDERGLYVEGKLLTAAVTQAREAHALMQAGAVSGLSIGYFVRASSFDERTGVRTLTVLDLVEVSLVTFPANDAARVDAVKMKLAHGGLPDLPEFESFLREAGFSKSLAAVVANRGLAHVLNRSESEGNPANPSAASELVAQIGRFSLPKI